MKMLSVLLLCGLALAAAGIPIPNKPYGFSHSQNPSAPVTLAVFGDLMCPDTKASYPNLLAVADYYGSQKLDFVFHTFPLPETRNSYFANQGAFVVQKYNMTNPAIFTWIATVFANQGLFWNHVTHNQTADQIIATFGGLAEKAGVLSQADYIKGMADPEPELNNRWAWKYGCSRAVTGTPTFYVNDVEVDADPTWTLKEWRQVIDPLFGIDAAQSPPPKCPTNTTLCEYLPNKYQCCLPSEMCIKNAGCYCDRRTDLLCAARNIPTAPPKCPDNGTVCEFLPNKYQCCLPGFVCVKNVGCDCVKDLQ